MGAACCRHVITITPGCKIPDIDTADRCRWSSHDVARKSLSRSWSGEVHIIFTDRKHNSNSLPFVELHAMNVNSSLRRRQSSNGHHLLIALVILTIIVVLGFFVNFLPDKAALTSQSKIGSRLHGTEHKWHGGHPSQDRYGSCWCGGDKYCMCTPSVAIDIVIYFKTTKSKDGIHVWVVRRADTGQLATIGGFVNVGETVEAAVLRETGEETGIIITPEQAKSTMRLIGVYSDPRRDNRRHIVSIAYALEFVPENDVVPKAGDDAKEVVSVPLDEIGSKYKGEDWYADHLTILLDFKEQILIAKEELVVREGELYRDIARSTCSSSVSTSSAMNSI